MFEAFRQQAARQLRQHDREWVRLNPTEDRKEKAYRDASTFLADCVLRPLFYLPPGELTLGDFCRALFRLPGAEQNEHLVPAWGWLRQELVRRGIVETGDELNERWRPGRVMTRRELDRILSVPSAARAFVADRRSLFGLPPNVPFQVLPPRVLSFAQVYSHDDLRPVEVVLRVRWWESEVHDIGNRFGRVWRVARGSSVTIDVQTRRCRAVLKSERSTSQRRDRSAFLRRLANEGLLIGRHSAQARADLMSSAVLVPKSSAAGLWLANSGRALHLIEAAA